MQYVVFSFVVNICNSPYVENLVGDSGRVRSVVRNKHILQADSRELWGGGVSGHVRSRGMYLTSFVADSRQ